MSSVRLKNPYRFVVVPMSNLLSYTDAPINFSPEDASVTYPDMVAFWHSASWHKLKSANAKTVLKILDCIAAAGLSVRI